MIEVVLHLTEEQAYELRHNIKYERHSQGNYVPLFSEEIKSKVIAAIVLAQEKKEGL